MLQLIDDETKLKISNKILVDVNEFCKLDKGSKLKCADKLYSENRVLQELGEVALDVIEDLAEQNEIKQNKINILNAELKDVNSYDEIKINKLMNINPVISSNNRERAKIALINKLKSIK